jgi:hypothetical protein
VATSQRAVELLADDGDTARHVWTLSYNGLLLTGVDRYAEALTVGAAAVGMAERLGSASLLGLAQGLHGRARYHLGDEGGHDEMLQGIATAAAVPHHQHVLMTASGSCRSSGCGPLRRGREACGGRDRVRT